VPNVPLLGGFAAVSGVIQLESVIKAIRERFSGKVAEGNIAAATEAYQIVRQKMAEAASAAPSLGAESVSGLQGSAAPRGGQRVDVTNVGGH
jgi:hypothetical protein